MQRIIPDSGNRTFTPKLKALASMVACILAAGQVGANPLNPAVISGEAVFASQDKLLRIANSPGAIIHWQDFSIDAGETTRFDQLSAASSVLNRVTGSDPSAIFGTLSSNGRVFLINPSGILFGEDARIDVAGLVASTLNLGDEEFRAGKLNFNADPDAGDISNQGRITTPSGGNVYLLGANVTNGGLIHSPQGDVLLAAGQSVSILDSSAPGVRVELSGDQNTVINVGDVLARSGQIGIFGAALRVGGSINADQVITGADGRISLRALHDVTLTVDSRLSADGSTPGTIQIQSETGTTLAEGVISARGTGLNSHGGDIRILGNKVGLLDVSIDASGTGGGGSIRVGGDYLGGNPDLQNASITYAGAKAAIRADAITQGDGGKVILWADDFTRFLGAISARGGAEAGNGGFVETSGKRNLEVLGGSVNTSASYGVAGTWLLDPSNVEITNAASTGPITGGIFAPTQDTAILNNAVLSTALETGNVNVTTTNAGGTQAGTITVTAAVTRSAGTGTTTLTLTPNQTTGGTITTAIGGSISGSAASPLNVALVANGVGATVAVGAAVTTHGGTFSSTGTTFTNQGGTIDTSGTGTGGSITLNHTTTMTLANPLISGGGNISIAGGSTYTGTSTINAGAGTITLRGSSNSLAIGIGSTTGTYNITQAQIANMTTTGGLIFGHTAGTGAITLATNEAVNFGTKNVLVQQATGGITVTGSAVSGSGTMSFVAGTGTFLNNSQVITNGAVNVTADLVVLNADIVGTGKLTITPFTQSLAIGVGTAPTRVDFGGNNFNTTLVASNSGRTLRIGSSTHTGAINVIGAYNPLAAGLELVTGGLMTINAAGTVTSADIALAGSNFINNAGAAALVASNRWLVYSADPALNTFGSLASGNLALWGRTFAANPPSSITATGKRYIFSKVPQMTATLDGGSISKVYGTDLTGSIPAVTVTGLVDASAYGNVFLQDSAGGTATASSAGYAATAAVNNGVPYAVSISGLTTPDGYGATIYNDGQVTVTPYKINLSGTRAYNGTASMPAAILQTNTLVGTQTLTLSGTGTVVDANVGTGKILSPTAIVLGNGTNGGIAANYTLTGGTHAVNITQAPVSFGTNDVSKVYDGTLVAAGATVLRSGTLFGTDTFSGGNFAYSNKNVGAGNKTVTIGGVSINDGNGGANYSTSYVSNTTSTISPFPVSLSGLRRYDGTVDFLARDVSTSALVGNEGLSLSGIGTVASAGMGNAKPLSVGTLTLGDGVNGGLANNYTLAGGNHLASITGALLGITANDARKIYNGLAWLDGNGVTFRGFIGDDSAADLGGVLSYNGTSQGAVNVGSYSINPAGLTSNNYVIEFLSGSLDVTPAPLGITANSAVSIYDGLAWFGGNGVTFTGFQDNDTLADLSGTLAYGGGAQGAVNVGNYSIHASGLASSNYSITYNVGNLAIAPASLGIISHSTSKIYGESVVFDGTEFRSNGLKHGETIGQVSLTSSGAHPLASVYGSPYQIIPYDARGGTFNPDNYKITYFNGEMTVLPAGLLGIAANSFVNVYDGIPWSGGAGVSYSGFLGDDTAADLIGTLVYGGSSQGAVDVGTYRILPSGQSSPNYDISYIYGTLVITPTTLAIIADNRVKNFGTELTFTDTGFHSTGLRNNETIGSVTLASLGAAANASVAGSPYAIVPDNATGGTFKPANYTISYIDGSLEVIPVGLLGIAANSAAKIYDGLAWTGGNGVDYSGFQGGDTAASLIGTLGYGGTSQGAVNVGNYSIVPFGLSSPNYTITYVNGNLAVNPAQLSITALDLSKNYGTGLVLAGTEFRSAGLVNGETIGLASLASAGTVATAGVSGSPYGISVSNARGGSFNPGNYITTYATGNLNVNPLPLSVVADSKTKLLGSPDPAFTFSTTGLVNNPQLGVVDTVASVLSGALTRAPGETVAGNPFTINRGTLVANSNYTLSYTPGSLLITAPDAVVPGPGPGLAPVPVIFAGLVHNVFYYRPGNFWHISLNASGGDHGFDVLRGTSTEETRLSSNLNRCDSVSGRGFCETWAFPQQQGNGQ